jgi:ABC-type multidrug transport system fused ATPase/permease subunit
VLQDDHLFDTTVRDNLLVGDGEASDSRILEVCEIAGLSSFLARREGGLEAQVGPDGELLSGGERQRLMIARALLASAPILVLDEATEHLEASLRAQIMTNVFEARKGQTTVVLAHDVAAIANADIIYDLVDGRFVPR